MAWNAPVLPQVSDDEKWLSYYTFDIRLSFNVGRIVDVRCVLLLDFDIRSIGFKFSLGFWLPQKLVEASIEKRERMVWYREVP